MPSLERQMQVDSSRAVTSSWTFSHMLYIFIGFFALRGFSVELLVLNQDIKKYLYSLYSQGLFLAYIS